MKHSRTLMAALPAALVLALGACTVEPDMETTPANTRTDAPVDEHLRAITDTEARVDPQVDDYHRVHPESKEDPEEASLPQIPPPDHPLPRLEGDPTPVPAADSEYDGPYREEPATSRSNQPLDSDPPSGD